LDGWIPTSEGEFLTTSISSPPAIRSLALDSFHPKLLDEAVSGGSFDHVQIQAGRFAGQILHAQLGDCRFDYGAYNLPIFVVGAMPADRIVLGFVESETDTGNVVGVSFRGSVALALTERSEFHCRFAPRTRWMGFQLERAALETVGVDLESRGAVFPPLDAARRRQVSAAITDAVEILRAIERRDRNILDPVAAGLVVKESLTATFAAILPAADGDITQERASWRKKLRLVMRTHEFFKAHFARPIQVMQLCRHVGASASTLERSFIEVSGVNPKQFLTILRMARARRALLEAGPTEITVAKVASECGFFHFGRFASHYAALYGESPLVTLRSRTGGSAGSRQRCESGYLVFSYG
jgi:AraC-like DNA-binding protein